MTPIKNMVRTATRDVELARQADRARATSSCCSTRRPTATRRCSTTRSASTARRTPNEHVAFGFGTHFCLGASLARLEIAVMLDELLARMPDLRLADPAAALELRPANFVSGLEVLPVRF